MSMCVSGPLRQHLDSLKPRVILPNIARTGTKSNINYNSQSLRVSPPPQKLTILGLRLDYHLLEVSTKKCFFIVARSGFTQLVKLSLQVYSRGISFFRDYYLSALGRQ
jgi:hypothetical protein